jgi:16S rRNA processing protein RimM
LTANNRICIGAFAGAHGVKGEAKVKTFTEEEKSIAAYGPVETEDGAQRFTLKFVRIAKPGLAVVCAPEIRSREAAQSLAGTRLYVDRSVLPRSDDEDEFYLEDLVGLTARDDDGAPMGQVSAVHNFGAGDILELKSVPGRKTPLLIPFTKATTPIVDIDAGHIVIARAALAEITADPDPQSEG